MRESGRSKLLDFLTGAGIGALAGLIIKELDLTIVVSYWGERAPLVPTASLIGALSWLTALRRPFGGVTAALACLWIAVAFTPLTSWMARDLERRDPLENADAVFVLSSGLQEDGGLSTSSMSRLVRGLEVIGEGWTSTLILSELSASHPRYRDAAEALMESLGLEGTIVTVGPVRNTHDEAVAVAAKARELSFERVIVVTSPSHTRRACAALEVEGVNVVCVPASQIRYDFENLADTFHADDHLRAFAPLLHEHVGLFYYRLQGWVP